MASTVTSAELEAWLRAAAVELAAHADELTALDSAIGDADHGTNMARGFAAVIEKLDAASGGEPTVPALLKSVGMTLVSKVGGASGSLYGTLFLDMAKASPAEDALTLAQAADVVAAGVAGVVGRGHAVVGDKTMIDAWEPAVTALQDAAASGASAADAFAAAAAAAAQGRDATEPLIARKGRASYLGERSAGHIDPGAASTTILLDTLARVTAESASDGKSA
ncbi:MAG: dihydroxyacetone kinase subunit L [Microbacterium sp.]|uniref:dihydroxyacetone kinase subunit DhaL n=1 Tax=Microbacterium sp. TaxID=51671 RepID=UPI001AD08BD8|nr:dihydroxyacetone kinase subunit DhaL [Microbacterium sp.]MBN9177398.1 dihydroxyacetone kinase subunit L [Microbacterium sp.]